MKTKILTREILCSGKFLTRYRAATIPTSYSIGYSYRYEKDEAGVHVELRAPEGEKMYLALTPEQAEQMGAMLIEWAGKTREYQGA